MVVAWSVIDLGSVRENYDVEGVYLYILTCEQGSMQLR